MLTLFSCRSIPLRESRNASVPSTCRGSGADGVHQRTRSLAQVRSRAAMVSAFDRVVEITGADMTWAQGPRVARLAVDAAPPSSAKTVA